MSSRSLPDFPWDSLRPARARAAGHPGGVVDLSIGTPVDPTPDVLRTALADGSDSAGYPTALGTADLRTAAAGWLARRLGVQLADPLAAVPSVIPTVGSKELVALLPTLLGLHTGTVVIPEVAYPTYEVGAVVAGLSVLRADAPPAEVADPVLVWLNSPGNPHGRVLTPEQLRAWVAWGRERGVPVVADECYVELGWDVVPTSVLHPSVAGATHDGLLAVHSLSKQSTAAGYRAGLLSGDPALVARVWEARRHLGLLVPGPVQAAAAARSPTTRTSSWPGPATARAATACARPSRRGAAGSSTPRPGSTCGSPATRTAGRRSTAWPAWASSSPGVVLRPGGAAARAHGADRHRRARRRRRGAAGRLDRELQQQGPASSPVCAQPSDGVQVQSA